MKIKILKFKYNIDSWDLSLMPKKKNKRKLKEGIFQVDFDWSASALYSEIFEQTL